MAAKSHTQCYTEMKGSKEEDNENFVFVLNEISEDYLKSHHKLAHEVSKLITERNWTKLKILYKAHRNKAINEYNSK